MRRTGRWIQQLMMGIVGLICIRNAMLVVLPELMRPPSSSSFRGLVEEARILLANELPSGESYWMAPALLQDSDFYQHVIFGAWPARPNPTARYLLVREAFPGCELVQARGEVALVRCDE